MTRVYVPKDAAALAVGAEATARAFAAAGCEVIRTGSRGLLWLEPLVEVETAQGRRAYGPVTPADVPAILAGGDHSLALGDIAAHPWLAGQHRITFARCGAVDPLIPQAFEGLARAREIGPDAVIEAVTASGLRGRGGAGFPAGVKWRTVREAPGEQRYVVCNADEGDSGTFADRMLMEGDPFLLIEGLAICAYAVGAAKGYIYSRSEYPHANATMLAALDVARREGLLGSLSIELRIGAGAYVCGEETALLDSLEGKRGQVRAKPPLPAHHGLFGQPTVVNNVLTLATAPWILTHGAKAYAALGSGRSQGTMPIQLAGNVARPGLYEAPFGLTLGQIVHDIGGGTASGRPVRAVQCGGPLGAYFPPTLFDTPYDYEAFAARDGLIGHGGIVVFDDTVDMAAQARFAFEFCAIESCGKCTPCRIGSVRGAEIVDRITSGGAVAGDLALVEELCETLKFGSLCALGGFTPYPVMSAIRHFPEDFGRRPIPAATE
ncbi:NADH-ubiquinone oxidoreductase-F iron-sulfur binding region domain-containing protein [uncultured Phenylobacterium sp.]|uniref:NADH-ubiquinone oxidoreductase-F iron-sulfur binding region domain-containing protein n=1 Tax=uncultured Phenylobacterium sp. TaxID=349273 RepID=UPI0025E724E0|nr:NADH-ubiquinone oxidoreductase-F iron-sulfur binding region domain-containing protein [uncultured Phenylobacterium sp.]